MDEARRAFDLSPVGGQKLFTQARHYDPFDPDILNSEGVCWYDRGKYDQAETCFAKAREMARLQLPNPDKVYSWCQLEVRPYARATANLGLVHLKKANYQAALELFQECLQRCPDANSNPGAMLGTIYHRLGQLDPALARYRENLDGFTPDGYFDTALVLFQLGRRDEAVGYVLQGLSLNGWMVEALLHKPEPVVDSMLSAECYDWAARYSQENRRYWPAAGRKWLKILTQDPEVRELLQQREALDGQLEELRPGTQRSSLVSRLFSVREALKDADLAYRVASRQMIR